MSPKINNNLPQDKDTRIAQLEQALAIEAALEKVRVRTMTMQKSEELAEVASLVFQQLKAIGLVNPEERFHFSIHDEQTDRTINWMTEPGGKKIVKGFEFQLNNLFHPLDRDYAAWKNTPIWERKNLLLNTVYEGETLKKLSTLVASNPDFVSNPSNREWLENTPSQIVQNCAHFSHGVLCVTSPRQFPKKKLQILQRFAITFEQTYTRFLDLQKAEEQTREAQIEAALERVRAASMAMHKSEELPNVALAILKEANYLNIAKAGCAIGIFDMEERTVHSYGANMVTGEIVLGKVLNHSIDSFWVLQESVRRIDIGDSPITIELKDKHLQEVADYINDEDDSGVSFHLENKSIYYNLVPFYEYSVISISSLQPLLESEFEILKRMARTLRMSYIRFLDLQKAEAQAKEAQIEAALERVRAASMAMHKPEELSAVALVIFQQLASLGIQTRQSWIAIIRASEGYGDIWSSMSKTEAMIPNKVTLNLQHTAYQPLIEEWKSGAPFLATQFEGAEVVQHFQKLNEMTGIDFYDLDNHPPYIEHFEACHQYGVLSIEMDTQIEQSIKDIVLRLAKVFEQTYTRFLDLQKAEEQAREAQIEAALERVRAASMAMHKSKDLGKVIQEVMHQMEQLGVLVDSACIHVIKEGTKDFGIWVATTPENSYPVEIYVPYIKHITMDRLPQSIAQKEKLLVLSDKFIDRVETKKRFFLK